MNYNDINRDFFISKPEVDFLSFFGLSFVSFEYIIPVLVIEFL